MAGAVSGFGVLIGLVGFYIAIKPTGWEGLARWMTDDGIHVVAVARLAIGAFLVYAASACRWPGVVMVVGVIAILSGLSVWVMGREGLRALVEFFLELPPGALRIWGSVAVAFGALMFRAGV